MAKKKIEEIKHGERIMGILDTLQSVQFSDLIAESNLDRKTLQTALNRLRKNGFAENTDRGWQSLCTERTYER